MRSQSTIKNPLRQKGVALVILVVIIVLAFISYIVSELSVPELKYKQQVKTMAVLKKAKQAVINYAVTYIDRPTGDDFGIFPCPETFKNGPYGNMSGTCNAKNLNAVEWFPWRSLDLSALKDNSGTCLFYAVSGTHKMGARADMINEDSIGMFQVVNSAGDILQGVNIEDRVIALVIAPGGPLAGQARNPLVPISSCGDDYGNQVAYLEGDGITDNSTVSAVEDTIDQFIHATETSINEATPYNDKFLTITRDEIWKFIVERSDFKQKMENLTQGLALCLAEYANMADNTSRRLPWPVVTNLGITTNYRDNDNYTDDNAASNGYSGRFPFNVANSNNAIWPVTIPTGVVDDLFEIIDPTLFPLPPPPPPPPPNQLCGNIDLSGAGAGPFVDLTTSTSEYRKLWNNWKDHFFYILSKRYDPDNDGPKRCMGPNNCIWVNGAKYAGAVIFSGSRLDGITRNDKSVVSDYLEDGKGAEFIEEANDKTGDRTYGYTDPQTDTKNDVMYCITNELGLGDPLQVNECI